MRIASLIARYLLGLMFLVFGANKFFHFIPMQPMPGLGGQFMGAMFVSHYIAVIALLEIVGAVLLLVNRYVPLALTLTGPVVVNILLFHAFFEPSGLPIAVVLVILWFLIYASVRSAFAGIFQEKA